MFNVSPKDLLRPGFVAEIQYVLFETGMPPSRLEIEITESIFISATDEIAETIRRIQSLGVSVALDDFGTGYSGLSYLDKFRVDRIKVDSSFVAEIETSQGARSMISTIISMARERGYNITVEGIENEAHTSFCASSPVLSIRAITSAGRSSSATCSTIRCLPKAISTPSARIARTSRRNCARLPEGSLRVPERAVF